MPRTGVFRGQKGSVCLPLEETRLFAKINQGFTEEWWDDYHRLVAKRQKGRLSKDEHRELIRLTDQLESREAQRLRALVKLAKLRKQSLSEVMAALGLPRKSDG